MGQASGFFEKLKNKLLLQLASDLHFTTQY
jgi:hypothetical protein